MSCACDVPQRARSHSPRPSVSATRWSGTASPVSMCTDSTIPTTVAPTRLQYLQVADRSATISAGGCQQLHVLRPIWSARIWTAPICRLRSCSPQSCSTRTCPVHTCPARTGLVFATPTEPGGRMDSHLPRRLVPEDRLSINRSFPRHESRQEVFRVIRGDIWRCFRAVRWRLLYSRSCAKKRSVRRHRAGTPA